MSGADVRAIEQIPQSIADVRRVLTEFNDAVCERNNKASSLREEAQTEERTSQGMLDAAIAAENIEKGALVAAEAALASLIAASVAQPALLSQIPAAERAVHVCKEALDIAIKHRQMMEKRLEIAQNAARLAVINEKTIKAELDVVILRAEGIAAKGIMRLSTAYAELTGYALTPERFPMLKETFDFAYNYMASHTAKSDSCTTESNNEEYKEWKEHEQDEKKPITPEDIRVRLNPSKSACIGLLRDLCTKDKLFERSICAYRTEGGTEDGKKSACLKIRKNMSGRLAEEIVRTALSPFGSKVETQKRYVFDDGTYTKTDLVLSELVAPIILGRGAGMGAREGGSLAVEVKAGQGSYLIQQKGHLIFQAGGHTACDVSCVICTRDVKEIAPNVQKDLREAVRVAGSHMIGMLPYKSWLDEVCEKFVFGVQNDV